MTTDNFSPFQDGSKWMRRVDSASSAEISSLAVMNSYWATPRIFVELFELIL